MAPRGSFDFRKGCNKNDSLFHDKSSTTGEDKQKKSKKWLPCVGEQQYGLDEKEAYQPANASYLRKDFDGNVMKKAQFAPNLIASTNGNSNLAK